MIIITMRMPESESKEKRLSSDVVASISTVVGAGGAAVVVVVNVVVAANVQVKAPSVSVQTSHGRHGDPSLHSSTLKQKVEFGAAR
jgi:phenylpyruvate tautomerase PptA (4-oxalocrotonate tautomerase family)